MTPRSTSSPKATTSGRKRALTLVIDVKEEVCSLRCVPKVTKHHSSEVQSSNLGGDISSSDERFGSNDNSHSDGVEECTTPKAEENRIAKVMTCPPPPRKRRATSSRHCSVVPSSAGFFCPADLELVFLPRHNIGSRI